MISSSHCSFLFWRRSDWRGFCGLVSGRICPLESLLQGDPVGHPAHWVLSLQFLKLNRSVLVKEFVQRKETASDPDLDFVFHTLDRNTLCAELVDTLRLAHKHDFELLPVRVVVDVLCELLVN